MLQQTSTSRVRAPWAAFLERFPTPTSCADATLDEVLRRWEGLGYHRRARNLHRAARVMRDDFDGAVPARVDELRALPGVGEYTANAVASFAFGQPVAVLDTNVGRVLARALANRRLGGAEARELARGLLPRAGVAAFNQAMIDLGAQHCRAVPVCASCPLRRVCRWRQEGGADPAPASAAVSRPQGVFAGSTRQLRGRVLALLRAAPLPASRVAANFAREDVARVTGVLEALERDGLVERDAHEIRLATR